MKKKIFIATILLITIICTVFSITACERGENAIFEFDGGSITALTDYGKTLSSITIPYEHDGQRITAINISTDRADVKKIYYEGNLADWCAISINGALLGRPGVEDLSGAIELYIDGKLIEGEITIPEGVNYIGNGAFSNCVSLTGVNIPSSVTHIGKSAFAYTGLESVNIPYGLKIIDDFTFDGCESLKSVTIPESVISIGKSAFAYSGLTSIEIPSSVKIIDESAFRGSALREIEIPVSVVEVGQSAFANCSDLSKVNWLARASVVNEYTFSNCNSLVDVYIPFTVLKIGQFAFYNSGLKSIKIVSQEIGMSAFGNCLDLEDVEFSELVTYIGESAFKGCANMKSVAIPKSVLTIKMYAFSGCSDATITCDARCNTSNWDPNWNLDGGAVVGLIVE